MLLFFAATARCASYNVNQNYILPKCYDQKLEIFDSLFYEISSASVVFFAPSTTPGTIRIRRSTFYKCSSTKRTIFDTTNYVILDFDMVCFNDISASDWNPILEFYDDISSTHTHNLLHLSLYKVSAYSKSIMKIWRNSPNWNAQDSIEFKHSNFSHCEAQYYNWDINTFGIIQICGYLQAMFQNNYADNKCKQYGLIYEKGAEKGNFEKFNLGKIDYCNFVRNIDEDNAMVFGEVCQLSVNDCHFVDNNYHINYALWSYNSVITISGNSYDSNNLCGTTNGGSFSNGGNNNKTDNQQLENYPHYVTRYCQAKNPYPPTSPRPSRTPSPSSSISSIRTQSYKHFIGNRNRMKFFII